LLEGEKYAYAHTLLKELNEIYLVLGINYMRLGKYDYAMKYLGKSLELSESNGYKNILGRTYTSLGILFNKQNDIQKEKEYLKKAIKLFEEEKDSSSLFSAISNLASSYMQNISLDSDSFSSISALIIAFKSSEFRENLYDSVFLIPVNFSYCRFSV
jgi:tetratricopeptide (TPR) repeat protein